MQPEECNNLVFDEIIISNQLPKAIEEALFQFNNLQVPQNKIKILANDKKLMSEIFSITERTNPRIHWLKDFSNYVKLKNLTGNVAECGVFIGSFAHFINKYFSDRKFYMFDSFEGFRRSDINISLSLKDKEYVQSKYNKVGMFSDTSRDLVLGKMLFPEKCEIHQGYIPESAEGLKDDFCFVNLDMDLYQPMFEGLKIFYPMIVKGGVLLLHDYFHKNLKQNVQKAVRDYEDLIGQELCKVPIGDFCSIAIIKR